MVDSNNDDDNGGSVVVSATCKTFHVAVDNNYKATEFKFFSAKRPHMRTFYIALGKNCKVFRLFEPSYHLKITLLPMKPETSSNNVCGHVDLDKRGASPDCNREHNEHNRQTAQNSIDVQYLG